MSYNYAKMDDTETGYANNVHYGMPEREQTFTPYSYGQSSQQNKKDDDFTIALIILILGLFFDIILLINLLYIKSENKNTRIVAYISIILFIVKLVIGLGLGVVLPLCSFCFIFIFYIFYFIAISLISKK